MICYASRTGTRRNLAALRAAGWRLLISRVGDWNPIGFRYCLDNGRWSDSQEEPPRPFDASAQAEFVEMVNSLGAGADFVVIPDTVGDRVETLALLREWLPRLVGKCPLLLIAVQDGMTEEDVAPYVGAGVGIFLGGSTEWKLATMYQWGKFCARLGIHFHVARVNTRRRFVMANGAGACSTDGSSASKFAKTLPHLDNSARQQDMFAPTRAA